MANCYHFSHPSAHTDPTLRAYLYNPSCSEMRLRYPQSGEIEIEGLYSSLAVEGYGFTDGDYDFECSVAGKNGGITCVTQAVKIRHGRFEMGEQLEVSAKDAEELQWELRPEVNDPYKGVAHFTWSRFRGHIDFFDRKWRTPFIILWPVTWGAPGSFRVPVDETGKFDALVPARVYAVMNVNSTGYTYDAMERWAWDYDLTRDREDHFTIGRTELYGMRAFDINGGPSTIFVLFRPTALSRILQFDSNGDGILSDSDRERQMQEMRNSPIAIGPELSSDDIQIWLNGKEEQVVQVNQIPEYDGDIWQVQYVVQIHPEMKPERGVLHEIKVEVRSSEKLHGEKIIDFGQGSVGFYRP